ncbi:phosphoenolpyruvate--protein phosphotransferase [Paenibacillus sp. 1P07SE]|uniref:phosphoenolpyruvate--protein phosphotransferase n=1 Tax=Paenibacillus sp. 1P07SE TaxID=3132209 RepID=UPI0039A5D79E
MADQIIRGIGVSPGIRIGRAMVYAPAAAEDEGSATGAVDTDGELTLLQQARQQSESELLTLAERTKATLGEEQAGILSGQAKFLTDPAFYPPMEKKIREEGASAREAVQAVVSQTAGRFEALNNAYMQERAADIRDLGQRLLSHLSGDGGGTRLSEIREEVILVAHDLAPSDTVQLDKHYVLAFLTRAGGKTSHTSLLARSLGIAAVVGAGDPVDSIKDGELLIVDGSEGICIVSPDEATLADYRQRRQTAEQEERELEIYRERPAVSRDGVAVETAANIGSLQEAEAAAERHAEGVGLYRTEFLFMDAKQLPSEDEQAQAYRAVAERMAGKPVIIRTLDIGGDKALPYLQLPKEENPFLGYRAIRIGLDRPELLLTQLRAILRASQYGRIKIMFPMISGLAEWRQAKALYEQARAQLEDEGLNIAAPEELEVGIMVEIPSAALQADRFAREVDFFSIGTNDLVQYTLAVDRMNEHVADLYDYFHPAVLQLIQRVIDAAHRAGKWAGMCGGMAGDPLAAPLLLGLGLDEWSMDAGAIARIKQVLSQLDSGECRELAGRLLELDTPDEVRAALAHFTNQH